MRRPRLASVLSLLPLPLGCEGPQSALSPRGPGAEEILALGGWMLVLTVVPALLTIGIWLRALARPPGQRGGPPDRRPPTGREVRVVVVLALGVVPVLLTVILARSFVAGRTILAPPVAPRLTIEVVGHQFWWEVRYPDFGIVDANELHVPVGEPVTLLLSSADVLHTFWVPTLHGKLDMFPGRHHALWIQADVPGVFRGQCAEFCGIQHALMALDVVAHPRGAFEAWVEAARAPAALPDDSRVRRGRDAYLAHRCDQCHAVGGVTTPSAVTGTGPDLTRVASRRTLGAGALRNNRGNLMGWILDPQSHKPGVRMPETRMPPDEVDALVAFLEALR